MSKLALAKTDISVFARTPAEMAEANKQLIVWADRKIAAQQDDLREAEENRQIAQKNKWRSQPWARRVNMYKAKIIFYEKLKAALEAGYYIVPPFPVDIFAVRTDRALPRGQHILSWQNSGAITQRPKLLPEGQGRYVSPEANTLIEDISYKNSEGKQMSRYQYTAEDFQEVDFPFKLAKPEVLTATAEAMARKLFDTLGVLPQIARRGDPIVVGQIQPPEQYKTPVTFFVAWWLDSRDL